MTAPIAKRPSLQLDTMDQFRLKGAIARASGSLRAAADLFEQLGDASIAQSLRVGVSEIRQIEQILGMADAGGAPSFMRGKSDEALQAEMQAGRGTGQGQ